MSMHPLDELVRIARERSAYYRELYASLPAGESRLERLPVAEQEPFWRAQQEGRILTGPLRDGIVFKSGGTTGNPKFSFYTRDEWETFTRAFGRGMGGCALDEGDRVGNLFYAGELYASFLFIHGSLERAMKPSVNFPLAGSTSPQSIARSVQEFSINALAGVPTTLLALAEEFQRAGTRLPSVTKLLFGGESVYPDQRELLQRAFPGARILSIGYASVDAGLLGYADSECAPGEHRAFEPETIVELVSEDSGAPISEPGVPGRLLVTSLTRTLMPVLRYPCGDRAQWVDPPGCPARRFLLLGRSEEGARVGPVSVYYEDVRQILEPFRDEGALRSFQLVIERLDGRDTLTIRVSRAEGAGNVPTGLEQRILNALAVSRPMLSELASAGKIGPSRVTWLEPHQIAVNPRTGKLRRVIDQRHDPQGS